MTAQISVAAEVIEPETTKPVAFKYNIYLFISAKTERSKQARQ
jgi:hypothetical protein